MREGDQQRIERLAGKAVVGWTRPTGGYTPADRFVVRFDDGSSAFAKIATNGLTVGWLRIERRWSAWRAGDLAPRILGFDDEPDRPLILYEDLSHGHWPPPWRPGDVNRLRDALAALAATRPLPDDLPTLERRRGYLEGWTEVARDPAPFLGLGMVSRGWLEAALPTLLKAQADTVLAGDDLLHFDVRSDNVCLLPDRVVLVDWNGPARGPAAFDLACWAPSLRLEAGPLPEELGLAASAFAPILAGYWAARAGMGFIPEAPRVRSIQGQQLRIALPWACRTLGLPPPDGAC